MNKGNHLRGDNRMQQFDAFYLQVRQLPLVYQHALPQQHTRLDHC